MPPMQDPAAAHAAREQQRLTAAKLVMLSTIFGWGGIGLLLVVGPALAIAVNGMLGGIVIGLGLVSAVAGAVIGQVGRGMQGRVI